MPYYTRAPQEIIDLVNAVLFRFAMAAPHGRNGLGAYQQIIDAKVKIDVMMAYAVGEGEDAIAKNGVKAIGLCSIRSSKLRACGLGDCEVMFDGDWWKDASDESRAALVDHELHHIDFSRDKYGFIKTDENGRPKLSMRPHTHEFGWFAQVAFRHGRNAVEVVQASEMMERYAEVYLPGFLVDHLSPEMVDRRLDDRFYALNHAMQKAAAAFASLEEGVSVTIKGTGFAEEITFHGKKRAPEEQPAEHEGE